MYEQLKDYEGVFNRDLEHYIMKFDNFLDKDLCKRGIEQLNEHGEGWQPHEFWEPKTKTWNKLSGDKENGNRTKLKYDTRPMLGLGPEDREYQPDEQFKLFPVEDK